MLIMNQPELLLKIYALKYHLTNINLCRPPFIPRLDEVIAETFDISNKQVSYISCNHHRNRVSHTLVFIISVLSYRILESLYSRQVTYLLTISGHHPGSAETIMLISR
jgi:hypothetical protein